MYKEQSHVIFPIRSNNEFQMKIRNNGKYSVYFHAWIDKRFDEQGEICLLLSHNIPSIPGYFNGTIYLRQKKIFINNFGFFRNQDAISISLLNEESLLEILCNELQCWSETMYD